MREREREREREMRGCSLMRKCGHLVRRRGDQEIRMMMWSRGFSSKARSSIDKTPYAMVASFAAGFAACYALETQKVTQETDVFHVGISEGRESEFKSTKIEQKSMKPEDVEVVIFHGGCPDGFAAAFAAYLRIGDRAKYYGIAHGKHKRLPPDIDGKNVCILDFSFDVETMAELRDRANAVLVLDHHASARKNLRDLPNENKVFEMKQSGATLASDFFLSHETSCPLLFRYIEDRDIWRWACIESREFSAGRNMSLPIPRPGALIDPHESFEPWKRLYEKGDDGVRELIKTGRLIVQYEDKIVNRESRSAQIRRLKKAPEHRALVVNATSGLASLLGNALASSERYDVDYVIVAKYVPGRKSGHGRWNMSLRSLYGEKESAADVSAIAEKYGGGGHRAAAGMSVDVTDLETLFCEESGDV